MSYSAEVLADSPLLYWRLNETSGTAIGDSSGSSRTGTYTSLTTATSLLTSDPSDPAVTNPLGSIASASWMNTNAFTAEALIKPSSLSGTRYVFGRDGLGTTGTGAGSLDWRLDLTGSKLRMIFITNAATGTYQVVTGATTLSTGTIYHVAISYDGTTARVYLNGVVDASLSLSGTVKQSSTGIFIGNAVVGASDFAGVLDEFAVYGTGLTTRIAAHSTAAFASAATTLTPGQATETDSALAATVKVGAALTAGIATETDSALTATVTSGVVVVVGQAQETDSALTAAISLATIVNAGQATETDSALTATLVVSSVVVTGIATETDTGLAAAILTGTTLTVGLALETDSALGASVAQVLHVGIAVETDTALASSLQVGDQISLSVGIAVETDSGLSASVVITNLPINGDTDNTDDGLYIDGTALVEWEPAVVPTPAKYQNILAMDTARAIQLTGIGAAGQPIITKSDKRVARARDRILLGGLDITYFRDVKTPTPDYRLIKPLLWGSATLVLPQVNPQYERLGDDGTVAVLKKIKADTLVVVQRVVGTTVVATDYVGFIDAINTSGSVLSLTLGGHASGRASNDIEPPPIFRARHDLKFQVLNYLQTLNLHTADTDGTIGIPLVDRGGSDGLTLVNDLVSLAVTADGDTFDVMPDANRVYDMTETDRETIHATVYLDDALATQQLDRAYSEESNIVYATGRTASGQVVNNAKAPGLVQFAADFPGNLEQDDTGATALNNQLTIAGYLNYEDSDNVDLFDLDTYYAVVEFQYDAGLPTTGIVNETTWNALWNLAAVGYSIRQARIFPMAQRSYTRKFNFAGNGSKLGENSDYDPHRIKRAVSVEVGSGFNRRRIKRFARSRLAPEDVSNWQGTLSLASGVIAGEHAPGDAITEADVMPARALRPGMNLWMPLFDGGTLFHIVTADVSNDGANVELHIDTQARDSIPLWEVISRNRETRSSVARRISGQVRSSQVMQDSIADWTDICGFLPAPTPLTGGEWTEIQVPAGQEGIVNTVRMQLEDPAPFAVLLMEQSIPGGPPVLTPLTDPRPSQRPWWERATIVDALKNFGYLDAWGTPDQPCGYDPGLKTDDQGATGDAVTGLFREEAGLNYSAAEPGRLYLYVWVASDNALEAGKILEQQLTTSV